MIYDEELEKLFALKRVHIFMIVVRWENKGSTSPQLIQAIENIER